MASGLQLNTLYWREFQHGAFRNYMLSELIILDKICKCAIFYASISGECLAANLLTGPGLEPPQNKCPCLKPLEVDGKYNVTSIKSQAV